MDENQQAAAPAPATESPAPAATETPAAPQQSTEAAAPATSTDDNNDGGSATPQATDPAVVPGATPDGDTPDHGVDPDKGIDPDGGDKPAEVPAQPQQDASDPSQMTEQQRAAYYHQLRNISKTTTEQALDARYQPQAVSDLKAQFMEDGYDEFQAQMLADRENDKQARELAEIRAEVSGLNEGLSVEAVQVVSAIPWLNPAQKDAYGDGKLATLASRLYENFVTRDPRTAEIDPRTQQPIPGTGVIIEAKLTPMQFYGALDAIRSSGASTASVNAQRAAERQMASVAPPSSTTSSRSVAFEQMSAKDQRAYLEAKGHSFN
jgi:hypothetical protein